MAADGDRGFTLLEVLVALAIAGLALVAMFRAGSTGLAAVDAASRAEDAVERARSHLAAIGRDVALLQGTRDGDDGGGYRWRIRIAPAAARQPLALYDVEVAESWPAGRHRREVVLTTRRLGKTGTAP